MQYNKKTVLIIWTHSNYLVVESKMRKKQIARLAPNEGSTKRGAKCRERVLDAVVINEFIAKYGIDEFCYR